VLSSNSDTAQARLMDPELEIQPGEYRHTAPPLTLSRSLRFLLNAPRRGDNPAAHRGSVRPDATRPTANASRILRGHVTIGHNPVAGYSGGNRSASSRSVSKSVCGP